MDERTGECVVAISLPLKNLKNGAYTLQIHVYDGIADVNQFHRVPIVITSGEQERTAAVDSNPSAVRFF
jgi:hypothetical protein